MALNKAMMSSLSKHWCSPDNLLEKVRLLAPDGQIDLDPCSNPKSIVRATENWFGCDEDEDGLLRSWDLQLGRPTFAYVNPPYGDEIVVWMEKCSKEALAGTHIVALVPSRTDPMWFHDHIAASDAICLWKGRLKFLGAPSSAPFPSCVAYWGPDALAFRKAFAGCGLTVSL